MRALTRITLLLAALLFTVSGVAAPRLPSLDWKLVPPDVVDALCQRLKMDAVATGRLAIVETTQPLISEQSIASLPGPKRMRKPPAGPFRNPALPIETDGSTCEWQPVAAAEIDRLPDTMVVELSAPVANPRAKGEAGLFARVSLGGAHPSWYWISMVPRGDSWSVRFVFVLSQ